MKKLFNKQNFPAVSIIILFILTVLALSLSQLIQSKESKSTSSDKDTLVALLARDNADAKVLKATLKVYYIANAKYPFSYDELVSYVDSDQSGNWSSEDKRNFNAIKTNLKDLNYTVRGDERAYQFTYTDSAGKPVRVTGEYQNDYH